MGFQASSWISAGNNFTCSVIAGGGVECIGYALDGHFGDGGGISEIPTPFTTPFMGIARIVGGNSGSFLLLPTGAVQAVGFLGFGVQGVGFSLRPTTPMLAPF